MKNMTQIGAVVAAVLLLTGASLPRNGPLPPARPDAPAMEDSAPQPSTPPASDAPAGNGVAPAPDAVPTPEPKPEPKQEPAKPDAEPAKPEGPANPQQPDAPQAPAAPATPEQQTLQEQKNTIEPEDQAAFSECEKELRALGADFETIARIDDGNGCGIDKPIKLSTILPGVKVKPDAVFRCPVALALAKWMKENVMPAAEVAVPEQGKITTINQASSYICRLRNSAQTGKISEHARGNAIDIASFSFEKGDEISVKPRKEDGTLPGAFQRAVSATACLYFTTVLDPESDEAHENHFHLDLLERKADYRYCH